MTLEGEYYKVTSFFNINLLRVAILMTLEGEYYGAIAQQLQLDSESQSS